jgi:hypothetical protein
MRYDWRVSGTPPAMKVIDATGKEWPDVVAVDTDTGIITRKVEPPEGTPVTISPGEAATVDIAVPAPVTVEFADSKPHKATKTKVKHAKDDAVKDDEE